jgi:phage repressor protein C with HTH and peptisase S24 domain
MGERHVRLIAAREAAGFKSARAAALRHHWTPSTYASHENGQTALPAKSASQYARAFKVSAAWLLTGEGQMRLSAKERQQYVELFESLPPEIQRETLEFMEFRKRRL